MAEISLSIAESRTESLRQPGRPARSLEQHRQVAEAIRAGDSEEAARAMHTHIDTVGRVKLLDWQNDRED
ncbi:FCD domain-containing protein [Streptomyces sp. NPDC020192]|uniref:FCD domain-containing protein n=1 Tax=Streptomyces sp. NPDC020192 TaxID=3365066 RepID=UPI0037AF16F1